MTTYSEEFKLTIVKLAESGRPVAELSREYDVGKSTINYWRRSYRKNANNKVTAQMSPDQKRIRELEKQLKDATLERDILKKAVHIFSRDRKSTRLNSSHVAISYAVFCLKKKNTQTQR